GLLIDLGVEPEVIEESGAWFSYGDIRLGQGRENAKAYLKEHPELAAEIEAKVRELLSVRGVGVSAASDDCGAAVPESRCRSRRNAPGEFAGGVRVSARNP